MVVAPVPDRLEIVRQRFQYGVMQHRFVFAPVQRRTLLAHRDTRASAHPNASYGNLSPRSPNAVLIVLTLAPALMAWSALIIPLAKSLTIALLGADTSISM